ncbi:sterol desaturase family protein, partial [Flavobacteriaceae bacterium]|nr:sterol desaturase family protein [Flavobacteriaceae bacterium]
MEVLNNLWNEIVGFFGVNQFLSILETNEFDKFLTYDGIVALIIPVIPLLLFLELFLGFVYKKPQTKVYKVIFLIYLFNRIVGRFISI